MVFGDIRGKQNKTTTKQTNPNEQKQQQQKEKQQQLKKKKNSKGEQFSERLKPLPRKSLGNASWHWLLTKPCRYLDSGEKNTKSGQLTPSLGHWSKMSGSHESNVVKVLKGQATNGNLDICDKALCSQCFSQVHSSDSWFPWHLL